MLLIRLIAQLIYALILTFNVGFNIKTLLDNANRGVVNKPGNCLLTEIQQSVYGPER